MFRPKNSSRHIFISVYQCIVSKINFTLLNLDKKNLISWEYLSWVSGWHHSRSSFCRYSDQLPHKSSLFQVGNFLVMNLIPLTVITGLNYSIYNTIKRYIYSPFPTYSTGRKIPDLCSKCDYIVLYMKYNRANIFNNFTSNTGKRTMKTNLCCDNIVLNRTQQILQLEKRTIKSLIYRIEKLQQHKRILKMFLWRNWGLTILKKTFLQRYLLYLFQPHSGSQHPVL